MTGLLARYLAPATYLLWAMIIIGSIDHFFVEFLPRPMADVNLYVMWPVLAIVWFGHRHIARERAQTMRDNNNDGV